MLDVELQRLQRLLLLDEVGGVQSRVLVEDLKVLVVDGERRVKPLSVNVSL